MPVQTTCPQCQRKLRIADETVGKKIKCPGCAAVFAARASAPPPSPEREPAQPAKAAITRCTCSSCGSSLKLSTPVPAGKRIKCPKCTTVFQVTEEKTAVVAVGRKRASDDDESASARTARRRAVREENRDDRPDQEDDEEARKQAPRRRAGKTKDRKASLACRVSALILSVIGGLFSGGLGTAWIVQANSPEVKAMRALAATIAEEAKSREVDAALARLDRMVRSSYFLLLAAPLGMAGGVLALLGRVKLGGAMMLAAVPVPLILNVVTLMPLYFLLVGGVLALLTPSWPPRGGPATVIVALLTAGGWVAVLVGWVVVMLVLPKPNPEAQTRGSTTTLTPSEQWGGPSGWPGSEPKAKALIVGKWRGKEEPPPESTTLEFTKDGEFSKTVVLAKTGQFITQLKGTYKVPNETTLEAETTRFGYLEQMKYEIKVTQDELIMNLPGSPSQVWRRVP